MFCVPIEVRFEIYNNNNNNNVDNDNPKELLTKNGHIKGNSYARQPTRRESTHTSTKQFLI